jgi:hypothetical protein
MHSDDSDDSDGISAFLAGTTANGTSSMGVAEAVVSAFERIDQALSPIIGKRGVAALYKRTTHLTSRTHSWLPVPIEGVPTTMDLAALQACLAGQGAADAVAAGSLLLKTFHELLTSLIGPLLTARLLRPVWATFLSGPSAKDTLS